MNRFATISNLLQLITGVMAAVLVFTFAVSAERAWEHWDASLEARAVSDASRDLFRGMQSLRIERGTANTALTSADVASADTLGDIAALRGKSDAALESAMAKLGKLRLPDAVTRIGELRGNRDTVTRLRQDVDAAMRRPQADRPPTLSKSWVSAVGALVDIIDALSDRLSAQIDANDAFIADMTTIKQLAWSVREAAGTDRLMLGAAIGANNGLAPDQQRQLAELAGRMAAGWKLTGAMLQQPDMPARLKTAYQAAQDSYFTSFAEKRKGLVADLVAGQTPSLTGAEWVELSNPPLASLFDLANATFDTTAAKLRIEATHREEEERKEQRQRAIEQQVATFDGSVRGLLEALTHAATEMRSTSESMSATAEQTDRQATAVAGAATQASTTWRRSPPLPRSCRSRSQ